MQIRFEYCRVVCDPERFRDDCNEPMSLVGMGAIYASRIDGRPLMSLTENAREKLLARFYDPHHAALTSAVTRILDACGKCMIVDAHSFPDIPLPFEKDQRQPRPDICIGTSDFHTPEAVVSTIERRCHANGYTTMRNAPYSGTMVPSRYYLADSRVQSVMIELNRRLYMDETTGGKLASFSRLRDFLSGLLRELSVLHHDRDQAC